MSYSCLLDKSRNVISYLQAQMLQMINEPIFLGEIWQEGNKKRGRISEIIISEFTGEIHRKQRKDTANG